MASVRVEIFQDLVCPWCYIGKRRFDVALGNLMATGRVTDIELVISPYMLDPSAPVGAGRPVLEAYASKFGGIEKAESILAHVTKVAHEDGLEMQIHRAIRANTRLAHRLLLAVRQTPHLVEAMNEALYRGYFIEGADIGDAETLTDLARRVGVPSGVTESVIRGDAMDTELDLSLDRAIQLGINAVPTFVLDDRFIVSGAQDPAFFERVLTKMSSAAG